MKDQEQDIMIIRSGTTANSNINESTASTIKTEYSMASVPIKMIKRQILEYEEYNSYKPAALCLEQEDEAKIKRTLTVAKEIKQKHIKFPKTGVLKSNSLINSDQIDNGISNNPLIEQETNGLRTQNGATNNIYIKKKPLNHPHIISLDEATPLQYRGNISNRKENRAKEIKKSQEKDKEKEKDKDKDKDKDKRKENGFIISKGECQEIICSNNENSNITFRMHNELSKNKMINKAKYVNSNNQCVNVVSFQLIGIKSNKIPIKNETDQLLKKYLTQASNNRYGSMNQEGINTNYSHQNGNNNNKLSNTSNNNNNINSTNPINESMTKTDIRKSNIQLKFTNHIKKCLNEKEDFTEYMKSKISTIHQKRKVNQIVQNISIRPSSNNNKPKHNPSKSYQAKCLSSNAKTSKLSLRFDNYAPIKQNLKAFFNRKGKWANDNTMTTEQSTNSKRYVFNIKDYPDQHKAEEEMFSKKIKSIHHNNNHTKTITAKVHYGLSNHYQKEAFSDIQNQKQNHTEVDQNSNSLSLSDLQTSIPIKNSINDNSKLKSILSPPKHSTTTPLFNSQNNPHNQNLNDDNLISQDVYFTNGDIRSYTHFNAKPGLEASANSKHKKSKFNKSETPIIIKKSDQVFYSKYNSKKDAKDLAFSNPTLVNGHHHFATLSLLDEMAFSASLISYKSNKFLLNTIANNDSFSHSFSNCNRDEYRNSSRYKKEIYEKAFEKPDYKSFEKKRRSFSAKPSKNAIIKQSSFRKCLFI